MPNVIKSATTVSTGTIKKNDFLIGVETSVDYGPTITTDFWSGINPPLSGYTVYAHKTVGNAYQRLVTVDNTKVVGTNQTDFPTLFRTLKSSVNTSGTAVTWVSGDKFRPSFVGEQLLINNVVYTVATYTNDTSLVLSSSAGSQTGVNCLDTPYLRTVANGGKVQNANGYDIGFYTDSSLATKYDWEIESYSATTGEIVAWIKKTLTTATNPLYYLSYGNTSITTNQSNPTAVWDANFRAVYHLSQSTGANSLDSTSNAFTLVPNNSPVQTAGEIDGSLSFDGVNQSTQNTGSTDIINPMSTFTVSTWIYVRDFSYLGGSNQRVFSLYNAVSNNAAQIVINTFNNDGNCFTGLVLDGGTTTYYTYFTPATFSINTWYHVAMEWDGGTTMTIYVNGVSQSLTATSGLAAGGATPLILGARVTAPVDRWFNGIIDEFKISDIQRSSGWIGTEYNNQSSPTTFYSVGSEEISGEDGPSIRVATNNSDLITIAKQYGGTSINTIYDALNYFDNNTNYMVANIEYENIVTDGLTAMWDGGFVPSYPRTGTTWSDLSGNGYDLALVGPPIYSGTNGGGVYFNGTTDTARSSTITLSYPQGYSLSMWFEISSLALGEAGLFSFNGSSYINLTFVSTWFGWETGSSQRLFWNVAPVVGQIYNISCTYDPNTSTSIMYYNGTQVAIDTNSTVQHTSQTAELQLDYNPGFELFNGVIYNCFFYTNKVLSPTEVTQNFDALRGRYGL